MDDHALLREYFEHHSEAAFAELVERHINLVYAHALRTVGDPTAAEDITQMVFIQLAQKGWTVRNGHALAGWLYRVTRHTALDVLRSEQARHRREMEAMQLKQIEEAASPALERLGPMLDEALRQLSRQELDMIMLCYFEGRSARETGEALALSETAAQKRLNRAVEKLRIHFARRGVTVASAALIATMSTQAGRASPVGLADRVKASSLAAAGEAGFLAALAKLIFMTTKTKLAMGVALAVILTAGLTLWLLPTAGRVSAPVNAQKEVATDATLFASRTKVALPLAPPSMLAVVAAQPEAGKPAIDPRVDLATAIPEAIRLIKAGDELAFQKKFMQPAEINRLETVKQKSMEEIFGEIDPQDAAAWLQGFEQIAGQTPVYNTAGDEAVYKLNPPVEHYFSTLTFVRVDGLWYWRIISTDPPAWYREMYPAKSAP